MLFSSLLFNVIPQPTVDYCRVFTPILYFQPSPSQSDLQHFFLRDLLFTVLTQALRFWMSIFYPQVFFTWWSFTNILPAFIKASLGASNFSLKFAGLHTGPWNKDLVHLFVWFTVIHNLHIENDSFLNSTKHYDELLVLKVWFICSLLILNSFCLFRVICKTIKNTLNQTKLVLLITASMNIKVIFKKQSRVI